MKKELKIRTVEELWKKFETHLIPPDAPEIQHREMKVAFYGGFTSAFQLLVDGIGSNDDVSEEEGAAIMGELQEECNQFWNEKMMENPVGKA